MSDHITNSEESIVICIINSKTNFPKVIHLQALCRYWEIHLSNTETMLVSISMSETHNHIIHKDFLAFAGSTTTKRSGSIEHEELGVNIVELDVTKDESILRKIIKWLELTMTDISSVVYGYPNLFDVGDI